MTQPTKHLFFDLDHTLWDFDLNSRLAYQQLFNEQNVTLDLDQFIAVYEPLNLEFWRRYRSNLISKEDLRYQRLKAAFDLCNYKITDHQINLFADLYIKYLPNYNHLLPGCIEMLDALHSKYTMHLITNGFNGVQQLKVDRSGLSKYFQVFLTAESAGFKKPAPQIFYQALGMAGAKASQSIMIGDSYTADIVGAQQIGMSTIWYTNQDHTLDNGQLTVQHLSQIIELLSPCIID